MDPAEVARTVASARKAAQQAPKPAAENREQRLDQPPAEPQGSPQAEPSLTDLPTDPATRLERDALMAILQHPTEVGRDYIARVASAAFIDNTLAVVRDAIATSVDKWDQADWLAQVASEVPTHFSALVKQLGVAPIPERAEAIAVYCKGVTASVIDRDLLRQKKDLLGSLQRLDAAAQPEKYTAMQRELMHIEAERRALRND
jgi:DNA primase